MLSIERRSCFLFFLSIVLFGQYLCCVGQSSIDGRHSFSLTTFDTSGKLGQVERASVAASLGTPIVAVIVKNSHVVLASPQILPSPLMHDDGTARFAPVAPHIAIAHSGISADGRVLVAAAQRLAVEHAYTFDESIPIELFLQEMSLLFQEYTMKPAARPFGATLLVAYLPRQNDDDSRDAPPQLFRIDPSGSIVAFEKNFAVINWKVSSELESKLTGFASGMPTDNRHDAKSGRRTLSQILEEEITDKNMLPTEKEEQSTETTPTTTAVPLPLKIISASLSKGEGLVVERRKLTRT